MSIFVSGICQIQQTERALDDANSASIQPRPVTTHFFQMPPEISDDKGC